jgi:uncharacterized surface protein with fasciclin (FAS1) repeats
MKRIVNIVLAGFAAAALAVSLGGMGPAFAKEMTKMVGGAPMYPSKNIVQNAMHSKDHTRLVAAVKTAGLVKTLESPGPFTVFAPTNEAFAKLPAGTVDSLLKPENKKTLTNVLTYHVVAGRLTAKDLMQAVKKGRRQGHAEDGRGRPAYHRAEGRQAVAHRRQGRHRPGHHPQRHAVERRHPRHRYRAAAGLIAGFTGPAPPARIPPPRAINPALTIKWANIAGG